MRTIDAKQFQSKYGDAAVTALSVPQKQGYFSRVGSDVKGKVGEATQSYSDYLEKPTLTGGLYAGANIAKNVSSAILSPVTEALKPVVEPVFEKTITPISEAIVNTPQVQRAIDIMSKNPELAGAIADTIETGLNVAGIEGTIYTFKGGINFVKNVAEKGKDYIPPSGPDGGIKGTANKIADVTGNAPSDIMNRVARLKPNDAVEFKRLSGKTQGEYLTETGNFGSPERIITNEARKYTQSMQSVDTSLEELKGVYQAGPVEDALTQLVEKVKSVSTPNTPSPYLTTVMNLYNKYRAGGLTMGEINIVKRLFEKNVKLGYNKLLSPEKVELATNIDNAVRTWQVQTAYDLGFKNIFDLNKQTQLSKFLVNKLGNQVINESLLNGVTLTDWIVLSGGNVQNIAGFFAKKFFSNKAVQAKLAELLNQKGVKGMITPEMEASVMNQLRGTFPQGVRPELPAPATTYPPTSNVPVISLPKSTIETPATQATRSTINPKTGDVYVRDLKTGKLKIVPKNTKP